MSVKIRLRRMGKKKQPHYRIVVADSRAPRDGRFVENLGYFNPLTSPARLVVDLERVDYWLSEGAITSDTVGNLVTKARSGGDDTLVLGPVDPEVAKAAKAEAQEAKRKADAETAAAKAESEAAAAAAVAAEAAAAAKAEEAEAAAAEEEAAGDDAEAPAAEADAPAAEAAEPEAAAEAEPEAEAEAAAEASSEEAAGEEE